jgi:hypothetical protein
LAKEAEMTQDKFERWLIARGYARNTAYSYSRSINRISSHYSEKMREHFDIYRIRDAGLLTEIVKKYLQDGIYSDKGNEGNGTNRAAVIQYKNYFEHFNSHPKPPFDDDPREKTDHSHENPTDLRDEVIGKLRVALKASEKIIGDLRAKGKRAVAERDGWEQKAKSYQIENGRLKVGGNDTARFQRAKAAIIKCLHRDAHTNASRIEVQLREEIFKELWPEIEKIDKR